MALDDPKQRLILTHTALVGLTPLIPVPLLDDVVHDRLRQRLVRFLAMAHEHDFTPAEVRVLANRNVAGWAGRTARAIVLYPVRKVFRKTFIVLGVKEVVDVASECWHRAFLLDHALDERLCAPTGPHSAAAVRAAIDAVCVEVPITPVEPALRTAFEQSSAALGQLAERLRRALGRGVPEVAADGAREAAADAALDEVTERAGWGVDEIAARLSSAMSDVPAEHLDRLRGALDRRLAPRGRA